MRYTAALAALLFVLALHPGRYHARPAYDDAAWRAKNDRVNRYEGVITRDVVGPDLQVLSLMGFFEPFRGNVNLKVRFFYPRQGDLSITAQEIVDLRQYWMEVKPLGWSPGSWNEFKPWPTGDVILREDVAPDNIGVLIRLDGNDQLLPAFTYHSSVPDRATRYAMHLRTGKHLRSVRFTLSGVGADSKPLTKPLVLGPQTAGIPFRADLDARGFADGLLSLKVWATPREGKPWAEDYRFQHRLAVR